jgi:hypothetical protein
MYSVDARPCTSIATHAKLEANMECVLTDEAIDTGDYIAVLDLETLLLLFGDIDTSALEADRAVDYDTATQEEDEAAAM